ncbi:MAG: hypothetical protein HOE53_00705 [Candidatus Magasanikbacteria bacterium]|nr:hypothetical protein [Candidatus Magasanikbacteria bacterium]
MKFWKSLILTLLLAAFLLPSSASAAQLKIGDSTRFLNTVTEPTGLETTDLATSSGVLIKLFLSAVGIIFLVLMVYGGFLWMTARGEEAQVEKAKSTITAAVIGISIVVSAYAITTLITSRLIDRSGSTPPPAAGQVGDAALGCCVIETGPDIMACRLDTETNCQQIANDLDAQDDTRSHPRVWVPNLDGASCDARCGG